MILGILSDTHGFRERTARAISVLEQLGAEAFVHCGDVGSRKVLGELSGRQTWLVPGNVDALSPTLMSHAESLGLHTPDTIPLRIEIAGRTLAVYHGHESHFNRLLHAIRHNDLAAFTHLTSGLDYVLYGHTHRPSAARVAHVRLINPGALERVRPYTVATLDLTSDALKFWQVDESAAPTSAPRPFTPR